MKALDGRETPARILVVDDDEALRLLTRAALEEGQFELAEAEDGTEALALFDSFRPDLVLLDVVMPALDGFATCRQLRGMPGGADTPVLMMTGNDDCNSIRQAYAAGATDFITKPINYVILRHRVDYMLRAGAALLELRANERRLKDAQRIARLGDWEWKPESDLLVLSDEARALLGIDASGPLRLERLLGFVIEAERERVRRVFLEVARRRVPASVEHRLSRPGETERTVHHELVPSKREGSLEEYIKGTVQDVTERKAAEKRIARLAFYDELTELPNRAFLTRHLGYIVQQAKRYRRDGAVLSLDLDGFKRVNDTLGHGAGDDLLREVARRLTRCVRASDCLSLVESPQKDSDTVARFGGDEFIMLLTDMAQPSDAAYVAQRVLSILAEPVRLGAQEVFVTASIGIALFPDSDSEPEVLLRNADAAMYHAKENGRSSFKFYSEAMNNKARERLSLENGLRHALERGEFELHYQPKLECKTRRVVGAEALLRWNRPGFGVVPPLEFISLAEDTGLIVPIGAWVVRTACWQAKLWQQRGFTGLSIAVNISARQFRDRELVSIVRDALSNTGLDAKFLELEITEGTLMQDVKTATSVLNELRSIGVRVSIDDFGTGYSSLGYLRCLPVDSLKVDRSFMRDVTTSQDSVAIATAIIAMSRSLRLKVVAEGVETPAQHEFLIGHGCDEVQGFLFSRPLPAAEFAEWLAAHGSQGSELARAEAGRDLLRVARSGERS